MPKQKFSPLPAAAFQILMALVDDDLHGYEIVRPSVCSSTRRMIS